MRRMSTLLSPDDFLAAAADAGTSMSEVCRAAGIAPSTFSRWKAGQTSPSIENYQALLTALRNAKRPAGGAAA